MVVILLGSSFGISGIQAEISGRQDPGVTIQTMVAKIKTLPLEPYGDVFQASTSLLEFVRSLDRADREALDPEVIDEIASLVDREDIRVRSDAESALADIGPPALRAVGALLRALRLADERYRRSLEADEHMRAFVGSGWNIILGQPEQVTINDALMRLGVCVPQGNAATAYNVCDYLIR